MAFNAWQSSYAPSRPDAQGYQGAFAQPNTTSQMQGQGQPNQPSTTGAPPSGGGSPALPGQSSLYPSAPTARPTGANGTGTPVLSDGRIPPAQPSAPAAPAPQPAAQAQPAQAAATPAPPPVTLPSQWIDVSREDPGWVASMQANPTAFWQLVMAAHSGEMTPEQRALVQQHIASGAPITAATGTPGSGTASAAIGPRPPGTNPTQLLDQAAPTYTPAQFTRFGDHYNPVSNTLEALMNERVQQMLLQPRTMNDFNVRMLQEQQREQALAQQAAVQQALQQQQVQSGFEMGGGYQQAQQRRLGDATTQQLLQSNRDIALQKMQQDRLDELNALQAAQAHAAGRTQRAIGSYGAQLQGEQAQAQQGFQGYASQADAFNNANQVALAAQQHALQRALGEQGIGLDRARLGESGRQFDLAHQLNWAALMNDMFMGRGNLGLGYAGLEQNAQNAMWNNYYRGQGL